MRGRQSRACFLEKRRQGTRGTRAGVGSLKQSWHGEMKSRVGRDQVWDWTSGGTFTSVPIVIGISADYCWRCLGAVGYTLVPSFGGGIALQALSALQVLAPVRILGGPCDSCPFLSQITQTVNQAKRRRGKKETDHEPKKTPNCRITLTSTELCAAHQPLLNSILSQTAPELALLLVECCDSYQHCKQQMASPSCMASSWPPHGPLGPPTVQFRDKT